MNTKHIDRVRINEQIRVPEVRVIDSSGEMLGVMATVAAVDLARSQGLDLIEVSPKAAPPVVKIFSYDKYRYQQEKREQQQKKKQKKVEVKGVRISVRIGAHDMEFKAKLADKFLAAGNKVKIDMFLRGREKANTDFALGVMNKFLAAISVPFVKEQDPKRMGGMITAIIGPKT